MGCCTGSIFSPSPEAALDPLQRVNYASGMVLGVDDFRQEQAYLMARDERALRETIGYGVISGLGVSAPKPASASEGQQVRVAPGLALMPDGRLVGVATEQCANLQAWLDAEATRDATTASKATVHVLLRYAQAGGSPVPMPEDACAYSRILDSFTLDFSWTPPDASEDLALRAVVAWIRGITVRTAAPAGQTLLSFQADVERGLKEAIRAAWSDTRAPAPAMPAAETPPLLTPSRVNLPAPPKTLQIPRADMAAYYAAAFEVWTRLLRSGFMAHHGPAPAAEATAERALLLAAVDAKAGADGTRGVRMLGRPQLLHLRLLQEWLLRDGSQQAPREAHYLLGKGNAELGHAQDLAADFKAHDHALARIDISPDKTDGAAPGDTQARMVAAVKWPGGGALGAPDYYGPGMSQPIPVADGGTGLARRPAEMQMLIGVTGATARGGDYALAKLVNGSNTRVNLRPAPGGQLELSVDVTGGGSATQVITAGNASNPPSLTAVTAANVVTLNTVQPLHPAAAPRFQSLSLAALPQRATPMLVGWDAGSGELVRSPATQFVVAGNASNPASLTAVTTANVVTFNTAQPLHPGAAPRFQSLRLAALPQRATSTLVGWDAGSGELVQTVAPPAPAADTGRWDLRYVRNAAQLRVTDKDHVIIVTLNGSLALPDMAAAQISEGRVIVIKTVGNVSELVVSGIEGSGPQVMKAPQSITVIAATQLAPPQWLVIART